MTDSSYSRPHYNVKKAFSDLSTRVNLRLILVSGKTQDFTFSPNDSATDIARHVFEHWPAGQRNREKTTESSCCLLL
ncbi:hypothetical protein QTP70_004742 [Hemibagrus guttatus]|uniref:UBL3-like ubiquitin domain-containing protein n=1 Tax=Hemibagrus guttatus TaxID=175788 RepID=A0AAE0V3M0_9TELE|nr:hypothetical protein QTP70_004742 [Hemibagrus guttatus]KAK3563933.1 hypothetical protein QTP86_006205 [Hemibagrus guttatus]